MIIWALTDERVGGNNQSIAVAEKLSPDYITKKIVYNKFISIPNFIRNSSLIGVDEENSDDIKQNLPDVVICAGRRLSSVALNIKKNSGGKTFVINIMSPNLPFSKFDVLLLPKHDKIPKCLLKENLIETNGSLNRVNSKKMDEASSLWGDFLKNYKKPLVSLIIGGDTKDHKFNPQEFGIMVSNISNIVNKLGGTLLITSSRRTSDECLTQIKEKINCDHFFYDWKWEQDENNKEKTELGNPYFAFLASSDFLLVTGDSMSMVSEACSTGKPTYVYMPKNSLGKKHLRFLDSMMKDGYIKEFDKNTNDLEKYKYKPLNELERVAEIINNKIKNK